jgi:hypothetical protein
VQKPLIEKLLIPWNHLSKRHNYTNRQLCYGIFVLDLFEKLPFFSSRVQLSHLVVELRKKCDDEKDLFVVSPSLAFGATTELHQVAKIEEN